MPRHRLRTTNRAYVDVNDFKMAYEETKKGISLRQAAKLYGLCAPTLLRYKKKMNSCREESVKMGYSAASRVLKETDEKTFMKYLRKYGDIYFGLPGKEVRKLALEIAISLKLRKPISWNKQGLAGEDWLHSFLRRHPDLTIKNPRMSSINIEMFFESLQILMDRYLFKPKDIYAVDEAGITTMKKKDWIVIKQKGQALAAQKYFVTLALVVSASGNILPPFFVFPQSDDPSQYDMDNISGSASAINVSEWLQDESLLKFLQYFQMQTNCSVAHKVLLLLNSNISIINLKCLDYCKENGIVLLSLPPQCPQLQLLKGNCFDPFKKTINKHCDSWIRDNPEKIMKMSDIPNIVAKAMPFAFNSEDIKTGFQQTGIFSSNKVLDKTDNKDVTENIKSEPI